MVKANRRLANVGRSTCGGAICAATPGQRFWSGGVSVKVPADVGGSPLVGYVVSAAGDPAYGALLLGRDGRQDISTVAVAPEAAGQQKVPVTLGY